MLLFVNVYHFAVWKSANQYKSSLVILLPGFDQSHFALGCCVDQSNNSQHLGECFSFFLPEKGLSSLKCMHYLDFT